MKLHSQTHILYFHLSWLLKKNHQEPEIKHNGQLNEKKKVFSHDRNKNLTKELICIFPERCWNASFSPLQYCSIDLCAFLIAPGGKKSRYGHLLNSLFLKDRLNVLLLAYTFYLYLYHMNMALFKMLIFQKHTQPSVKCLWHTKEHMIIFWIY